MNKVERKKELLGKLQKLSSELVTNPEKLREFAERWRGGFRQYSFQNLLLIWFQRPSATLCAGFHQWKKHDRYVRAGEKAIWILAPYIVSDEREKFNDKGILEDIEEVKILRGFFPVHVFDYSQTDGQELLIGNTQIEDNGDLRVEDLAKKFEFELVISQGLEDGSTDGKKIRICRRKNKTQEVAGFFHEVAHNYLGHLGKRKDEVSREVKELEAEAVSYLVCSCLGFENEGAKLYIGHWKGDKEKIEASSLKILSVSEKILRKVKPEFFKGSSVVAC